MLWHLKILMLKIYMILRHLKLWLILSLINLLLKIKIIFFNIFIICKICLFLLCCYRMNRIFRLFHNTFKTHLIELIHFTFKSFRKIFWHITLKNELINSMFIFNWYTNLVFHSIINWNFLFFKNLFFLKFLLLIFKLSYKYVQKYFLNTLLVYVLNNLV